MPYRRKRYYGKRRKTSRRKTTSRRYKSYRKTYRNTLRKYRPATYVPLVSGIPRTQLVKLKYHHAGTLDISAIGTPDYEVFRANSCYDPYVI